MSNTSNHNQRDDRGVSELVGVVLLFGIVIAGSAMIFVSGTAVTDDVRAEGRVDAASSAFSEMDSSVQSLAQRRGNDQEAVSMGAVDPNDADIRDSGELEIQINENSACTATMDLSALEYENDGGTTIAYEGGAIWKRTDAGLVTHKAPELGYQDGALQLQVVRIDGSVEDDEMSVDYDRAESISKTEGIREDLFGTSNCRRPENFSITVTSDYYRGWTDHLESQFGESNVNVEGDDQKVTARADLDVEYDVIDIPGSGPGTVVPSSSGDAIQVGPASPLYAGATPAGDATEYSGAVTFLGSMNANLHSYTSEEETWDNETVVDDVTLWANETVQLSLDGNAEFQINDTEFYWDNRTKTVWNNTTVRKRVNGTPPLEVSFVLDESGSMQSDGKMTKARDATREFLTVMKDDQGHRVNLVGYDYCSDEVYSEWYDQWTCYGGDVELDVDTYQEFTTDQGAVDDALSELQVGGGTPIPQAIEHASGEFRADGNASNNQVLILLTDGKDEEGAPYPYETAQEEIPDDVTVYTIGVGDEVNEDVLENVATTGNGNGEYIPVADADELDSVFSAIARNETTEIVHVNESKNKTIPVKKHRTETRNVTIPLDEGSVRREVNVSRYLSNPEDFEVNDTVWVNGTRTVAAGETVSIETSVNRTIEYANGTVVTEPVALSRSVELTSSREVTVNESVELDEEHTRWENDSTNITTTHDLVLRRPTTLELTYNGSKHDLWSGENVNAFTGGVEPGDYSNVVVEQGSTMEFLPTFHECDANTTRDEQVEVRGDDHNLTTCTATGSETNLDHEVQIYANGETLPSSSAPDWQPDLSSMLTVDGRQYYERQGGDLVASNLSSNQAIVIVKSNDAAGRDNNNVVLLVELGESDEMTGKHLVNVEVTAVSAQSGDADDDDD
ncbi:vWA domain-containing protein [Halorubellus sp. PRR65]|uniref:vWA domain-containing protein n=1 Tax=Halorubellus sp. PRR65 TaxID=3098148 RepID=UPI002B263D70|nr:vWA domain-containing protein [Halorubellus sp. PRR65]